MTQRGPYRRRGLYAGLDTEVYRDVHRCIANLENMGRFLPAAVRTWMRAKDVNSGTRQTAKNIKRDIAGLRRDLDTLERIVCAELEDHENIQRN